MSILLSKRPLPTPLPHRPAAMNHQDQLRRQYATSQPSTEPQPGHDRQATYAAQYGPSTDLNAAQIHYSQQVQVAEAQRQHGQQYAQYGGGALPTIAQTGAAPAVGAAYDPMYRQHTDAAETLSSFSVPHTSQFYLPAQSVPTATQPSDLASSSMPPPPLPPPPAAYQQPEYAQSSASSNAQYSSNLMPPPTSSYASYGTHASYGAQDSQQIQTQSSTPQHVSQPQQEQQREQQTYLGDDPGMAQYHTQIRTVFTYVRDSNLQDIHGPLLRATHYLLGNVEALGLTRDEDTDQHDSRIALWDEFNRAWLVTLQRQLDLTEEITRNDRPLDSPRTVMPYSTIDYIGAELVRMCDSLERFGLVDYQMGVAEDEISELLVRCMHALELASERGLFTRDPR